MPYLLVEPDPALADLIRNTFAKQGTTIDLAPDGRRALTTLQAGVYDACIIELVLPDLCGLELIKTLRGQGYATPIMSLSEASGAATISEALDAGADDYLRKPVDLPLLMAKMRALSRRCSHRRPGDTVLFGAMRMSLSGRTVTLSGQEIMLRAREFDILRMMMQNPGKLLSVPIIMAELDGCMDDVRSNCIEVHLCNLRKKLGPRSIENVRGQGFRLYPPPLPASVEAPARPPGAPIG